MSNHSLRGAFWRAADTNDGQKIRAFIQRSNIIITLVAVLCSFICLAAAFASFFVSFRTLMTAPEQSAVYEIPAELGMEPAERVLDKTGYIDEYDLSSIWDDFMWIAEDLHIQAVLYVSDEPVHDVYAECFDDESGLVLYLEEQEDYSTLSYLWGSDLDYLFHDGSIAFLDSYQNYLDGAIDERSMYAVYNFDTAIRDLFQQSGIDEASGPVSFALTAFWLLLGILVFPLVKAFAYYLIGLPVSMGRREELYEEILDRVDSGLLSIS